MPKLILPATDEECVLWKKIVATTRGYTIESVTAGMKYRLKRHFYVEGDTLMCLTKRREVLVWSHLPELMREYHDDAAHPGRIGTIKKMEEVYASIPEHYVRDYIGKCQICNAKRPVSSTGGGRSGDGPCRVGGKSEAAVVSVWSRVGLELLDMTRQPNEEGLTWILQATDHASKFMYAVPLQSKTSRDVGAALMDMIYRFGPPSSLVHDRQGEFVGIGQFIKGMISTNFPTVKVTQVKGRSTVVNESTKMLESRLAEWTAENDERGWPSALQRIVYDKNNEMCKATGMTPFKLFFFRKSPLPANTQEPKQNMENGSARPSHMTYEHMTD